MAFKNRKQNYPLYETTHFRDFREMVENVAEKFLDKNALSFKRNPHDKEASHYTYGEGREYIRDLATEFIAMGSVLSADPLLEYILHLSYQVLECYCLLY